MKESLVNFGQLEPISSNIAIPTPLKKEVGCERTELEVSDMDIDFEHVSKKLRIETPPRSDIIIQEEEIEEAIVVVQHFPTVETS